MLNIDFITRTFNSPGYLRCTLPEDVKEEVQRSIKKINEGKIDTIDVRENLAGHLQKETSFPITEKLNHLLTSLCHEYDEIFDNRIIKRCFHKDFINEYSEKGYVFNYKLRELWINYGKKYDFNPPHVHHGMYSFVLWIKIPYTSEEEEKFYPATQRNFKSGKFEFFFPSSNDSIVSEVVSTNEWDLVLFPSTLHHAVYPFYSNDEERISISGNIFFEMIAESNLSTPNPWKSKKK
tara:strand:- start:147 stop:854 length:708 start_codon:yes stop_codon:yes gene_type:complete